MISPTHRAAREYGERGIAVFPVRNKFPLYGSHGENDGTTDPNAIDYMWARAPDAGVAAALRFTPYFVLDVDGRNDGDFHLLRLERERGEFPTTVVGVSGSGLPSVHIWFRRTQELANTVARALKIEGVKCSGVDVKGLHAGYIVLPPSPHPSGNVYAWYEGYGLDDRPVADPPAWLVDHLRLQSRGVRQYQVHKNDVPPEFFWLGAAFKAWGLLGPQKRPGVFAVACPQRALHSSGRDFDGSTVIFAPRHRGDHGVFFCSHAHCEDLKL